MTVFITTQIEEDGVKVASVVDGDWDGIQKAAAEHHVARITIENNEKLEISEQQRKWLHCKAGPIRKLMEGGWSFREAKEHLKAEYGREWFVVELTNKNFKEIDGIFRYECKAVLCRKLIHPMDIITSDCNCQRKLCPFCGKITKPVALKSIMDVSTRNINLWFSEIFAHMKDIEQPNPEWEKEDKKNSMPP